MPHAIARLRVVLTLSVALLAGRLRDAADGVRTCAGSAPAQRSALSAADDALLEDLSKRSFMFFWEHADPQTGIVRDRARTTGSPVDTNARDVGSIASVGFGLSGLCIAADRGWVPRPAAVERARTTLRFFATRMPHERGWFFHFVNIRTGAREWNSELSSIDSALLLAGVLTVRQCFADRWRDPAAWPTRSIGASISPGCSPAIRGCCRTAGGPNRDSWRPGGITTAS